MSQSDIDQWSLAATQTLQQNQAEQLRNSVSQALPVNPDGEAQTRRFASAAGVPLDTARAMPDVVRQQAQMRTFDAGLLARKFPATAQLLANGDNAKLLHDDIPATAQVEQAVRALPPAVVPPSDPGTPPAPTATMSSRLSDAIHYIFSTPGQGDTWVGDAGKVLSGGARVLAGTAKYLTLAASTLDRPVDALLGTNMQEGALALTKSLDDYSQSGPTKQSSFKDRLLDVVGSTGGVLLEAELTGGASVEFRLGATVMEALRPHIAHGVQAMMVPSAVSAQDTYNSVIKETNDPVAASKAALASYVTSTLGGVVPFATPGKLAYRMASGAAMGPLLGDVSHSVMNAALPSTMQEPARTWEDRGLDAVMGTMFGGLAGPKDVDSMHQRIGDAALQAYADAIKTQADVQSVEALHGLGQVSAIAKLRERDPAAFKQFVEQVSDDGHLKDVYLDPNVLAKAFQQSGVTDADLQAAMPDLPGRLHEALETNGDVRLSVADYATHIAGTPIDEAILPHLKTDPEGRTYSEAQTFYRGQVESLKAEADKIIAQTDDATAARAARDGIRDQVLNQLNTVNRFSSQVNRPHAELMADYTTTTAQRAGLTPEQFMQTYALQYRSDATGGVAGEKYSQADRVKPELLALADANLSAPGPQAKVVFREVSANVAEAAAGAGLNISGYTHTVDSFAVRHILKNHSDVAKETARGNLPLSREDIAAIPQVIESADKLVLGGKNKQGKDLLVYLKRMPDGTTLYLEEVRTGKRELAAQTLRKYPATTPDSSIVEALRQTRSKPTSQGDLSVVELGSGGNTLNQTYRLNPDHPHGYNPPEADVTPALKKSLVDAYNGAHPDAPAHSLSDVEESTDIRAKSIAFAALAKLEGFESNGAGDKYSRLTKGDIEIPVRVSDHSNVNRGTHFKESAINLAPDDGYARDTFASALWKLRNASVSDDLDLHIGGQPAEYFQPARGQIAFGDDITKQPSIISLFKGADLSTILHESGHFFLEVQSDLTRKIEARIAAGEDVGPGERSIAEDMATSLDWLGVKAGDGKTAMDKWNGMTLEEKRELHEKWARGFETYAMEGTAPSVGLVRAFQTFSNWLTHIYKTLTNLHAELTPEVRAVFDRMLASQDAIQTAEAVRGYKSLFETAEAAGMTPEDFAGYQKLGGQSTSDAIATMQARSLRDMQWLSNAKSRALKELQAKANTARKDMREQVTKEVDATPAFAAKRFLDEATDPLAGYKSDMADWRAKRNEVPKGERDAWVASNPEPVKPRTDLDSWTAARQVAEDAVRAEEKAKVTEGLKGLEKGQALAKNKRAIDSKVDAAMIKWDSENRRPENSRVKVDMQIVADKFGFDTPKDMRAAIRDAGSRKEAIEGLTDQRMLEQHGDLIDARSVERAAEASIHNEARARFMATGLKALTKSPTPAAVIHEAARQAADAAVRAKRIGDLRPAQYAAAEAKNNREALKLAPRDTDGAIKAQRAALLNNQLFKRASDAASYIEKSLSYLKKFDKPTIRDKLDGAFLERIDQIRATLDLRRTPSETNPGQEALITWADGLRKLGYEPQIADWLNALNTPMHYKDATVEQFQQVVDAVKSLDHIAREMKQITIDGKKIAVDEAVATLSKRMDERGVKFTKQELLEKPTAKVDGIWAATTNWIAVHMHTVHADLLPPEYKINKFDLHELDGPFRKMILDPILAGNYRKVDMTKRQSDMAGKVGDTLGKDWQHTLYDGVSNKTLMDPELSTPGNPVFLKMTRGRMLGIARHVGNESNFEKLTKGYGWKSEDVWAFLDKNMSEKDWAATQAHWDSFDPLWHESEALIRRQGGVPPPKIPAREFDTRFGKMRGGYSPIDYDPLRSKLAVRQGEFDLGPGDKVGEQMNYRATTTHNSSLVARSQGYTDRINLDLHSAEGRIRDTIHDLAYREALLDVGKIVNNAKFRDQFMQTYGREEYQALNDWLGAVRDMNSSDPRNRGFEKAMQYGRQGVVLTGIGYRISTVAKHGGAAALKSLGYLGNAEGAKYFAARVARMASGHMQEDLAGAREKFPEIRARLLQMDRDYKVGNRSMYESEGWKEKNDRFGHAMVAWSDALSATPTAWAAYDLAKTSGVPVSMGGTGKPMTEAQAVNYANSVVRQAHGSALESTRSNFMQASSIKGFFGALYGFMNNTYGQTADMLDKAVSGGYFKNNPAVAARLLATLLIPAVWAQWLMDSGPGGEESTCTWAGKAIASEVGAMVPFVRDAVSLLEYGRSSQIAPLQMVTDLTTSAKDFWDEAHGHQTRLVQDLSNTIGEWAHIAGLGQLGHILQYLRDVENGKKHPDSTGQAVKEAVIGGARHK